MLLKPLTDTLIILFFISLFVTLSQSCQNEEEINFSRYYVNGKGLYEKNCQNCHGKDGNGLGLLVPPLTDSVFLKQNKSKLGCIIKYGSNSEMIIHGKAYNESMPPNVALADIEIASIITYISNSFGNKQGLYHSVQAATDLKNCR